MRCDISYLEENVKNQVNLFKLAVDKHYDLLEFVDTYLRTDTRRVMEEGNHIYLTMDAIDIMDELETGYLNNVRKVDETQDVFEAEWLAEFYCRFQWLTGVPSSKIVSDIVPVKLIDSRYPGAHDTEMELVLENWIRDLFGFYGFNDEESQPLSNSYVCSFMYNGMSYHSVQEAIEVCGVEDLYYILLAKFQQLSYAKYKLLKTGNVTLALCTEDEFYGIGLSITDEGRFYKDRWKGKNVLGECLMKVRSEFL